MDEHASLAAVGADMDGRAARSGRIGALSGALRPGPRRASAAAMAVAVAALAMSAPRTARAGADGSLQWVPWVLVGAHAGMTVGMIEAAGWPLDDGFARIGIGFVGALPAAGLAWLLWGGDSGEDDDSAGGCRDVACASPAMGVVEALPEIGKGLLVVAVDLAAAIPAMYFLPEEPAGAGWSTEGVASWFGLWLVAEPLATVLVLSACGVSLDDAVGDGWWGASGSILWVQAVVSTSALGLAYALGPKPGDTWTLTLPLVAGAF